MSEDSQAAVTNKVYWETRKLAAEARKAEMDSLTASLPSLPELPEETVDPGDEGSPLAGVLVHGALTDAANRVIADLGFNKPDGSPKWKVLVVSDPSVSEQIAAAAQVREKLEVLIKECSRAQSEPPETFVGAELVTAAVGGILSLLPLLKQNRSIRNASFTVDPIAWQTALAEALTREGYEPLIPGLSDPSGTPLMDLLSRLVECRQQLERWLAAEMPQVGSSTAELEEAKARLDGRRVQHADASSKASENLEDALVALVEAAKTVGILQEQFHKRVETLDHARRVLTRVDEMIDGLRAPAEGPSTPPISIWALFDSVQTDEDAEILISKCSNSGGYSEIEDSFGRDTYLIVGAAAFTTARIRKNESLSTARHWVTASLTGKLNGKTTPDPTSLQVKVGPRPSRQGDRPLRVTDPSD